MPEEAEVLEVLQIQPVLDTTLVVVGDQLDDIEKLRIATGNRKDALQRLGLEGKSPHAMQTAFLDLMEEMEKRVIKELEAAMAAHPLGDFVRNTKGLGLKSMGRFLGRIGDPYWHLRENRPRTFGELKAYCGFHVVDGHAPKLQRGVQANWNTRARSELWVIADVAYRFEHYRPVYDAAHERYEKSVHVRQCQNSVKPRGGVPQGSNGCGTQAHPEWGAPGSPWRPNHVHAASKRMVAVKILEDLWTTSRDLHEAGIY